MKDLTLIVHAKSFGDSLLAIPYLKYMEEESGLVILTGRRGASVIRRVFREGVVLLPSNLRTVWRFLKDLAPFSGRIARAYVINPPLFGCLVARFLGAREVYAFDQVEDHKFDGEESRHRELFPAWKSSLIRMLSTKSYCRQNDDKHEVFREFQLSEGQYSKERFRAILKGGWLPRPPEQPKTAITLAPYSSSMYKDWPPENYLRLVRRLDEALAEQGQDYEIVIVGSHLDPRFDELADSIASVRNMLGKTTIDELYGIVAQSRLLIGNDSFILHIASAYDCPAIGIFGANTPRTFGSISSRSHNFYKPPSCSPCIPIPGSVCLAKLTTCLGIADVSVEEVFTKAGEFLGSGVDTVGLEADSTR